MSHTGTAVRSPACKTGGERSRMCQQAGDLCVLCGALLAAQAINTGRECMCYYILYYLAA